jgi:hypothetical protein
VLFGARNDPELKAAQAQKSGLSRDELREFLTEVILTPAGKVNEQSRLCQSYKVTPEVREIRMPDKFRGRRAVRRQSPDFVSFVVLACRPCFVKRNIWAKVRKPSPRGRNSIPGQTRTGCRGFGVGDAKAYQCLPSSREFNISLSTVHDYIEQQRKLLRAQTIDLAAQERDQALQLIDNAIEQVVPHINGDVLVQTEEKRETSKGEPKLVIITVDEWQAT